MMDVDPPSEFASKEEEVSYWMDMAHRMHERNKDIERELEEYQESSIILERELETSFQQTDRRNRNLCAENCKLMGANEELRGRLSQQIVENGELRERMRELEAGCERLRTSVRDLERENEVLERAVRENKTSEEERESKLDSLFEKLALMETDLEEKDDMRIAMQRLRDENNELKQQIAVVERRRSLQLPTDESADGSRAIGRSFRAWRRRYSLREPKQQRSSGDEWSNRVIGGELSVDEHVRRLERDLANLEQSKRLSQLGEEEMRAKFNAAAVRVSQLEAELRRKPRDQDQQQHSQRAKSDLGEEAVQLRAMASRNAVSKEKSMTLGAVAGDAIRQQQDERERKSLGGVQSRPIEKRTKKAKEEEKRQQSLSSWLKRLRDSQPSWLRRK